MTVARNKHRHMRDAPETNRHGRGVTTSRRFQGLDAARAIAIIGMLAVNVGPRKEPGDTDVAILLYDVPHGRASLLFMILAGMGMSLMTKRSRERDAPLPWQTILWRAALLIVSGLALQLLGHDVSVILTYYGVLFLCAFPLLRAPPWVLLTIATLSLVVGPLVWLYLQQFTSTTFDFVAPSLTDPVWTSLHALLLTGAYPVVIWLAPFLFGLVLGRCQLGDRGFQHRLIGCSAAAALIPLAVSAALYAVNGPPTSEYGWDHLITVEAHSQMPLWMISGCGSAGLLIGVFLRSEDWVTHRLSWLVSAGRLSLTIYVAHLFVLAWLVRPEPHTLLEGFLISAIMSVVFVMLAHLWWRHFGTGPLERLLRWPPSLKTQKSPGIT
ncbi:MAG TPA: heparan-alpha-glucosaminide N-acetyltransferase domain-containing protein [Enteractinococcus sp.]